MQNDKLRCILETVTKRCNLWRRRYYIKSRRGAGYCIFCFPLFPFFQCPWKEPHILKYFTYFSTKLLMKLSME